MSKELKEKFAYSISEIEELAPFCRTRIYEEIAKGTLIARKAGRRTFILATDFERFLQGLPLAKNVKTGES